MKKRLISIMLVGALVVSMGAMAGCGQEEEVKEEVAVAADEVIAEEEAEETTTDEESADEESAAEETADEESADEDTASAESTVSEGSDGHTLTLFAWDASFIIPAMEAAEEDYKENVDPDFELNIIEQSGSGDIETLITNVASTGEKAYDELPDITLFQDHYFHEYQKNYPDVWIPVEGADIVWDNFSSEKLSYAMVDDTHYGVPVDSGTAIAAYRIDLLEEAGYTIDDLTGCTWDEFIEIGKDVYDASGKYLACMDGEGNDLIYIMLQAEGTSFFKDGEPYITENETLIEVMELLKEMAQQNVLLLTNSWADYTNTAICGDQVAGIMNGNWIIATMELVPENEGKWELTSLPTIEGGEGYAANGGSALYITAGCDNVDLAKDFLAWTFGGESLEDTGESITYDEALRRSGLVTTYTPAGDSEVYSEGVAYFNDTPIYQQISAMTAMIPTVEQNDAYYSARNYLAAALINMINGADEMSELEQAETQIRFEMGLD